MRDLVDELAKAKVKARLFGGDHAPRLGRLVVVDRLGAGAMGSVLRAYDPQLDREVAIKVLHPDAAAQPAILREARALGRLHHPNVVAVHDVGELDGGVYLVMELVAGVPLRAWIRPRPWRDVVRVLREVAAGVAALHRAGLIHRDIKPDNVLVGERAVLVDLGLATERGDGGGLAGDRAGTRGYLAPEVIDGGAATAASDQYAFGVTLHEALYGSRPAAGGALPSSSAPAWLEALVRRTLADDPARRFPAMDDVVAALGRERRRTRLAAVAAVAAVAAASGALATGALVRGDRGPACGRAGDSGWTPERSRAVAAALGDAPWARHAVAALDDHAARWQLSRRRVCEATRVDGTQSDRLLELRMRCLDRMDDRLAALAEALTTGARAPAAAARPSAGDAAAGDARPTADAAAGDESRAGFEAATAVADLPDPDRCEQLVDDAELALPDGAAARARAIAGERALDDAAAAFALGRYPQARAALARLAATPGSLDTPALAAAHAVLVAQVEGRIGTPADARAALDRALALTARAGTARLEHEVWTGLLRHQLFAGDPARAVEWAPFAEAAAARAGLDGAEVDGIVAEALLDAGHPDQARLRIDHALASADPLGGDRRALLEMNAGSVELARGDVAAATAHFERALALATAALGDGHPTLALYLDKLAVADRAAGRLDRALARHDASVALRTAAFGPDDRAVATARFHRAETLIAAGRLDLARADLDLARAIRARIYGAGSVRLGEIDAALGDVALAAGDVAAAREAYDRAAALDPRVPLADRRARLAAHVPR